MKGSGKQILLRILTELSTRITQEDDMGLATRRLRAGLLLHGSTAEESYEHSSRITWASRRNPDGELVQQGIAVGDGKVLLTELYDTVFSMDGLLEHVLKRHPDLAPQGFAALEWVMWLLVSSVQMYPHLAEIEDVNQVDVDEWVEVINRHYDNYFKDKDLQRQND